MVICSDGLVILNIVLAEGKSGKQVKNYCLYEWINDSIWAAMNIPLPNPTVTLACYQLTVVGLREG